MEPREPNAFSRKVKTVGDISIPDGIIKCDGFSTPQIDGTTSKETLLFVFTKIQHFSIG